MSVVKEDSDSFSVELEVFQGPFDLLLQLIARRELDITEVTLAQVTDEFLAYMQQFPDLSSMSEFLVVAATLLDMKAARLLPQSDPTDDYNVEEFSAKDLLFARLMLYRAFKDAASALSEQISAEEQYFEHRPGLEERFENLVPNLVLSIDPQKLAQMAAVLLAEPVAPDEAQHVARPTVSLAEEVDFIEIWIRDKGHVSFGRLVQDVANREVIVTRFLAVLELYRRGIVDFVQKAPSDSLRISLSEGK